MEIKGQRYRVDREIGKGAFGVVFLAHDNRLQRNVALKVMAIPEGLSDEDVNHLVERFYREARAAASLSHPNIVIIHDISKTKDRHFISMEYLQGRPLADLTEGPMAVGRALFLFDQVLDGLGYAHDKGVIHRDIKPDNIFVLPGDRVKLVDFGLARVQTTSTMTKTGSVMGSPGYIAPEMIEGKRADNRTDIFSAGVVLYEMLTGERPFGPRTSFESYANIIYRILSQDPQAPSAVNPEVPGDLDDLVVRCLAKSPDDRFQTVAELRAGLAAIAERFPEEDGKGAKRREKREEKEIRRRQAVAGTTDMTGPAAVVPREPPEPGTRIEAGAEHEVEEIDLFTPEAEKKKRRVSGKVLAVVLGALVVLAAAAVVLILVFAGGGGSTRCPNLISLEKADALKAIKNAGLKVGKETEAFSYDIWKGKVARQFPVSGTEVPKGSTVEIVVSIGQDVAAVPDVVNKNKAEAAAAITTYGFKVRLKEVFSNAVPADIVMEVNPAAGTVKPRGQAVLLVVSKGPFPAGSMPPPRKSSPPPPG